MITKENLKEGLKAFVFTRRCRFCGKVTDIREDCCEKCKANICKVEGKICLKCGCSVNDCVCGSQVHFFKYAAAPYYYDGAAKEAVRALKFGRNYPVGERLAEDMAQCFYERFSEYSFDIITFVPGTKNEFRKKRFNQSEFLAKKVSEHLKTDYAPLLEKIFDTKPQHTLRINERSGNLLGVFSVNAAEKARLENARILLIDDVKTTGATLDECAKTLLIGGAAEVFCLTAAVTRQNKRTEENKDEIF